MYAKSLPLRIMWVNGRDVEIRGKCGSEQSSWVQIRELFQKFTQKALAESAFSQQWSALRQLQLKQVPT